MPKITHVILDAMGVIFLQADDLRQVFMGYLESVVCDLEGYGRRERIERSYIRLKQGQIDSVEFFRSLGVKNPDLNFLLNLTLDPDFPDFAKKIRPNHVLVVLSNDSQEWALHRNRVIGMEHWIDLYLTSSVFGVTKPQHMIYKKMCWFLQINPQQCLYVDNLPENLRSAKELGMKVILFQRDKKDDPSYPLTRNFAELHKRIEEITS